MEKTGSITFKGNPMTLVGGNLEAGQIAPDFTALDNGLQPVALSQFKGQTVILSAVPSLDTPVCEIQTKTFNEKAAELNAKIIK